MPLLPSNLFGLEEHEQEAPKELLQCPITQELFQDPVMATDGYTYERTAIQKSFQRGNMRSPITNQVEFSLAQSPAFI
jgi:hypothetical protein